MATHATISQGKGSTGPEVTLWQNLLVAAGSSFAVPVTGVFDAATTAATKKWQASKGLTADGIVGPMSWAAMTGEPVSTAPPPSGSGDTGGGDSPGPNYTQSYGSKAQFGRDTILATWPQIVAEALQSKYPAVVALGQQEQQGPNLSCLQTLQAMAQLEGGYGTFSYKGPNGSKVLNNWGAVQAGKPDADGNCPAGSWAVGDSGAEGKYVYCYKDYPTAEAGCLSFLRECTIRRPTSWAIARTGDLVAYSLQMHSWRDPPLAKLGQGSGSSKPNLDPVTQVRGYFEQPPFGVGGRARGLFDRVWAIAQVLGEPVEVSLEGPFGGGPGGGDGGGSGNDWPGGGTTSGVLGLLAALAVVGGGVYAYQTGALQKAARSAGLGRWIK